MSKGSFSIETRFVEIDNPKAEPHLKQEERAGKAEFVTDLRSVLTDFGIKPELVDSTVTYTDTLKPLLGLIGGAKDHPREGRGVYLKGPNGETIYSKGNGSGKLLERELEEGEIPGFARNSEELMYDTLDNNPNSSHPRMIGTETLTWGMIEFIDACAVYAETAQREGWTDVRQAIEARVTIPIGVLSQPELSAKMTVLRQKRIDENPQEREFLSWEGNDRGLAAVGAIVPSDKRKSRGRHEPQKMKEEISDPNIAVTTGRTLRRLLDMGIVYNYSSAHGQNLYKEGLVAQADNSDFVFLGDYKTVEERESLIFNQLEGYDNMTPLSVPITNFDVRYEDLAEAQELFWQNFLRGIAHKDALRELPQLMPLLRTRINLATAKLIGEWSNASSPDHSTPASHWKEVADKRRSILKTQDPDDTFGTAEELDNGIDEDLNPFLASEFQRLTSNQDPLGVQAILKFLRAGDKQVLYKDEKLRPYLEITDALFAMPEEHKEERDKILEHMGNLQLLRENYDFAQYETPADVIDMFDNRHLQMIHNLIVSKDYSSAAKVAEILYHLQKPPFEKLDVETHEIPKIEFASDLLKLEKQPVRHKWQQVMRRMAEVFRISPEEEFDVLFQKVKEMASIPELLNLIKSGDDKTLDIESYASAKKVAGPHDILTNILRRQIDNNFPFTNRSTSYKTEIAIYVKRYKEKFASLKKADAASIPEQLAELESIVQNKAHIPELALAHNLIIARFYSEKGDIDKAKEYFGKATAYYDADYEKRQEEFGIDLDSPQRNPGGYLYEKNQKIAELADHYAELGFLQAAESYRNQES